MFIKVTCELLEITIIRIFESLSQLVAICKNLLNNNMQIFKPIKIYFNNQLIKSRSLLHLNLIIQIYLKKYDDLITINYDRTNN